MATVGVPLLQEKSDYFVELKRQSFHRRRRTYRSVFERPPSRLALSTVKRPPVGFPIGGTRDGEVDVRHPDGKCRKGAWICAGRDVAAEAERAQITSQNFSIFMFCSMRDDR